MDDEDICYTLFFFISIYVMHCLIKYKISVKKIFYIKWSKVNYRSLPHIYKRVDEDKFIAKEQKYIVNPI